MLKNNNMRHPIIESLGSALDDLRESTSNLKQKALDEFEAALKMPRKKKKIAKKIAQTHYFVACFEENFAKRFDGLFN